MPVSIGGVRLWNTSESASEATGSVDVTSYVLFEPRDTILIGLEAIEEVNLSGIATGGIISRQPGYSSDPDTALREWTLELESLCRPLQGTGYTLTDEERDRDINVVVGEVSWTRTQGETNEVRWNLHALRGEGLLIEDERPRVVPSPKSVTTEQLDDGGTTYGLGSLKEKRVIRKLELEPHPMALSGPDSTVVTSKTGVVRIVEYNGWKAGTPAELQAFDEGMRGLLGKQKTVEYAHVFPGLRHQVMLDDYDSTHRAYHTGFMEFYLKAVEGRAEDF